MKLCHVQVTVCPKSTFCVTDYLVDQGVSCFKMTPKLTVFWLLSMVTFLYYHLQFFLGKLRHIQAAVLSNIILVLILRREWAFFIKRIKETFCKGLKFMSKYFFSQQDAPR